MKGLLLVSILLITLIGHSQNKSEYGVQLVDEVTYYKEQIKDHPEFKMVDLKTIEALHFDIRYATENNFTKEKVYPKAEAFVREPLVEQLKKVISELKKQGLGLVIYDAYRPYSATVKFYELVGDTQYVASPYRGSRHNRGCAVDLSLIEIETGLAVEMPTKYDDFTEKAHPNYNGKEITIEAKKNRQLLIKVMENNGFKVYPSEWWHFDFVGWEDYPLMNLSFKELKSIQ